MGEKLEFVVCSSCQFENHAYCRFCLACGLVLEGLESVVRSDEGFDQLDPTGEGPGPTKAAAELVQRIVESIGMEAEEAGNGWKVTVRFEGGRKQTVFIRFSGVDDDGDDVISFVSLAAPVDPARALQLLRLNNIFHYCRVGIMKVQGQEVFGVSAKQLASTADDDEIRKILMEVALRADAIEERLRGGADDY